jgi:hypothetical protein
MQMKRLVSVELPNGRAQTWEAVRRWAEHGALRISDGHIHVYTRRERRKPKTYDGGRSVVREKRGPTLTGAARRPLEGNAETTNDQTASKVAGPLEPAGLV